MNDDTKRRDGGANQDPISGALGTHAVGTVPDTVLVRQRATATSTCSL